MAANDSEPKKPSISGLMGKGKKPALPKGKRKTVTTDLLTDIRWGFEVAPPPVPEKDIKQTYNADIIVVGAGTSGKAAALTACQAGATVIQLDRHTTFRWGGGHNSALGSRVQQKLGITVDKNEICLQLMKYAGNRPDQRLLRLWADNSGAIMDWILDLCEPKGVTAAIYQWPHPSNYDASGEYYPEFTTTHTFSGPHPELNQNTMLQVLENEAKKLGLTVHYQTRARQLVRGQHGRVSGVIAIDKTGSYVRYNAAKAVILCTGDYGNNPAMMQKYCPWAADIALTNNIYMDYTEDLQNAPEPINTGDGHQMAMWIGAVMEPGPHAPMSHAAPGPLGTDAFLHVNIEGERYENEDVPGQSIANMLEKQPGCKVFQIFDGKWKQEIGRMGIGLMKHYDTEDFMVQHAEEMMHRADSLEELAEKIGVPAKALLATVQRYNELARNGEDTDFGKRADRLTTIEQPPFFGGEGLRQFLVVLGGLNTNVRLQPLDKDRKVIPGLYLAGNTVGNRFAIDYPTMCPGLSHGMAWTTGYFAGKYAAQE